MVINVSIISVKAKKPNLFYAESNTRIYSGYYLTVGLLPVLTELLLVGIGPQALVQWPGVERQPSRRFIRVQVKMLVLAAPPF